MEIKSGSILLEICIVCACNCALVVLTNVNIMYVCI